MKTRNYEISAIGLREAMFYFYDVVSGELRDSGMPCKEDGSREGDNWSDFGLAVQDTENETTIYVKKPEEREGVYHGLEVEISGIDDARIRLSREKLQEIVGFRVMTKSRRKPVALGA